MPELTFFNRLSGAHIKPLCAHPANIPLTLTLSHKPLTGRAPVKGKGEGIYWHQQAVRHTAEDCLMKDS